MTIQDILQGIPPELFSLVCGLGGVLLIAWSVILYRRMRRNERVETPPQAQNKAPASAGIGAAIRGFFFYAEDEKVTYETPIVERGSGAPTAPVPEPRPPGTVEVLRVWRDVVDGTLIIQLADGQFRTMSEITQAGHEHQFMTVLRELARVAKGSAAPPTAEAGGRPRASTASTPPVYSEPVTDAHEAAGTPDDLTTPESRPADPEVELASTRSESPSAPASLVDQPLPTSEAEPLGSFFDNVKKAVSKRGKVDSQVEPEALLSIPEQIDQHLQSRLTQRPEWLSRSIHIRPAYDGGVQIEVDGKYYASVSDIEDGDVREFVVAAIKEWEGSN